jgi:tRNA-2-methylthio-N6-dimethylallyladenosine synthase
MRAGMTPADKSKDLPKTFHVKSFGCQMNVYDGERMAELMAADGMTATDDPDRGCGRC